MWLFLAFLAVPLVEIALFIQVGGWIGLWPTLAIVVLTALAGTWLVRAQGRMALGQLRYSFERLDDPTEPLAHAAMILVSGALLLTPGFFTDAVGFALLAPPVRRSVFLWLKRRVAVSRFEMGGSAADGRPGAGPARPQSPRRPAARPATQDVVDADFTDVPPSEPRKKSPNHPGSGWTRH